MTLTSFESSTIFLSIIGFLLGVFNLGLHYWFNRQKSVPALEINIDRIPPYNSKDDSSSISIRNRGAVIASDPQMDIEYSWHDGFFVIDLDEEFIHPEEEIIHKIRLADPPKGKHTITIEINVNYRIFPLWNRGLVFRKEIDVIINNS